MLKNNIIKAGYSMCLLSRQNYTFKGNVLSLGAVLFRGNTIYCLDYNKNKTHPALQGLYKYPFLHAEASVLIRHGLDNCVGLDLAVFRINKDNKFTMSKPCNSCNKFLNIAGIREVYYTDWNGSVCKL